MSNKQLLQNALAQLRARLMQQGYRTYKDEYVSPVHGVATGYDPAFVVDRATREALQQQAPQSSALLKPYLSEQDAGRWYSGAPSQWVLHIPAGSKSIEQMPAIKRHLEPFRKQLEQQAKQQQWFESRPEYTEYAHLAEQPKIIGMDQRGRLNFSLDYSGAHVAGEGLIIPIEDYFLIGTLNSKLYRLLLQGLVDADQTADHVQIAHIEALPYPVPTAEQRGSIGRNADFCTKVTQERDDFRAYMRREIRTHLGPKDRPLELSTALVNWHLLDIISFRHEVLRHFGVEMTEDMMDTWDNFLGEGKYQLSRMDFDLDRAERQIDNEVYGMFELTEEDIELLGQM